MSIFLIAEIGINHNGDMDITKKLIDLAKDSGCDAVKFQKRTLDIVYTPEVLAAPRESPWGTTQRQQKEGLEFGKKEYDEIERYCREKNIDWFASAWDIESQIFLRQYPCKYNKIASAMLGHMDFIKMVADENKHTFISTGMSTLEEIDAVVDIFKAKNCPFTLLHCVSTYPCKDADCNIKVMHTLRERYNCDIGYSGHEVGLLPSILAVTLGAKVIERHITLDRTMYGSDQAASLEKRGLELLVRDIREIDSVLGSGEKTLLPGELDVRRKLRYYETNQLA